MIVASNNNAAVENISKELPIAKDVKKSNTELFNIDENKEIYFSDIAKTLMGGGEECWGLISACLGKRANINELKQALWFESDCANLQQLYKEDPPDWEQAKEEFKSKHNEVLEYRRVINEAGQATPYSALGALWRTSKAIIVGDPLQVEPVVTVPKELSKRFAEEFKVEDEYKSQGLSVQVLADSINPYGGYREYLDDKKWLGCPLVVHRRCLDPMFSISNEVAYNNRMFKKSQEPNENIKLLFEKSIWIDVKGKENGGKDHFVHDQGDKVVELVLNAFALQNDFPSVYIISPFKSVADNIKSLLKRNLYEHYKQYDKEDIDSWIDRSCGTVHTFQGKEANEVILVLGCDDESGAGAAQWAGKKPNILNVAVTRVKYRIAIIGDSNLWTKVNNFDFAYKTLCED